MPIEKPEVQISASGPTRFGGIISEEFLPELRFPRAVRVYDEMRKNNPIVGGFMRAIEAAFRSTRWRSQPKDSSPEAIRRAEFLDQCLNDMDRPWAEVLPDILTFLPFGFAAMEMVFKERRGRHAKPPSKYDDGRVGFRDLVLIPHATILNWIYDPDDPNELIGIRQLSTGLGAIGSGTIEIPIEKCLLFRIRAEKDSPEGESVLRQAYRPYYFMNNLEVIEAISLERTGAGIPVVSLPQGASSIRDAGAESDEYAAQNLVRKIRADEQAGIVKPYGWEFDIVTSKGLRPELFDLAINRHRSNMLISVLAAFLELGTSRVGSYAAAKAGRSHFENALEGWVLTVEDILNSKAVPLLFELNGITDGDLPLLTHTTVAGESLEVIINSIVQLHQNGLIQSSPALSQYLADLLRLPVSSAIPVNGTS